MPIAISSRKAVFKLSKQQAIYFTLRRYDCESSNLVYVVICSTCNEEYIVETGEGRTKVGDRVRVYLQHIRQRNINNLNARNTFELVEKENSKYSISSNYTRKINT